MQLSTAARNARLDAIETTISTAPILRIYTGAAPANCAAANSGTELVEITLPSDWLDAASGGSKALAGSWTDTAGATADLTSTPGHYRIFASDGTTCHMQGGAGGAGQEIVLNNPSIASGQTVTVTAFTVTDGNA